MSYSKGQLKHLARNNPKEFIRLIISPNNDIHTLTLGVEIMGEEIKDESLTLPAFKQLLKHINAVVREGAMMGVSAFYLNSSPPQDILARLQAISLHDPSPACQDLAGSLLRDFKLAQEE